MTTYVTPRPLWANKQSVWQFAEEVGRHVGYKAGEKMEDVVARVGGRMSFHEHVRPEADEAPESIVVNADGSFHIYLPTVTSRARDRFTIAHELGHFFLHFPQVQRDKPGQPMVAFRWVNKSDPDQERAEWEANWFAAAFLMPAEEFTSVKRVSGLAGAAAHFGVSQSAAEVRARSLGL